MTAIHLRPSQDRPVALHHRAALEALNDAGHWAIATAKLWLWRMRERGQLARLDDRMLHDIGLTHADREFLVNKPFWRE